MKTETQKIIEDLVGKQNINAYKTYQYRGITSIFPEDYREFLNKYNGINGIIGENSYVQLWPFEDIVELNEDYESNEFLTGVVLIGSDGGEIAYGINQNGEYIETPFIGMSDEEIKVISNSFDGFIEYLYNI